jgi:uncharacterized membrane protein (DUF373 family)
MNRYFDMKNFIFMVKFLITFLLYFSVKDFSEVNSFSQLAVALLEFIIILELVRMLLEFMFSNENRIRMRIMIDSTIVFFIRDIMLIVNDKFNTEKIFTILGIIAVLILFRIIVMKYSPSKFELFYNNKDKSNI